MLSISWCAVLSRFVTQVLPADTYNQHVIHTMMDNSNPGSRDLVVLPTGLAHTVMYAYKYTVVVVAARANRYTQHIVSHRLSFYPYFTV